MRRPWPTGGWAVAPKTNKKPAGSAAELPITKTADVEDNKHKQGKRKALDKIKVQHYDKIQFKVKVKKGKYYM